MTDKDIEEDIIEMSVRLSAIFDKYPPTTNRETSVYSEVVGALTEFYENRPSLSLRYRTDYINRHVAESSEK